MRFFISNLFLSPLLALYALLNALPYILLIAAACFFLTDTALTDSQKATLGKIADWLPRKYTRGSDTEISGDFVWAGIRYFVILFLFALTAFRIQRGALRAIGYGDTGNASMLICPPWTWFQPLAVSFALAVFVYTALSLANYGEAQLLAPVETSNFGAYFGQHIVEFVILYIFAMVVFVPVGVLSLGISAGLSVSLSLLGVGAVSFCSLGVLFAAGAVLLSIGLIELALIPFATANLPEPRAPVFVYLAVQGVFMWAVLSVLSANLLSQRLVVREDDVR